MAPEEQSTETQTPAAAPTEETPAQQETPAGLAGVEIEDGVETPTAEEAPPAAADGAQEPPPAAEPGESQKQKPINQEAVDKKINKAVFEKHEERRKREAVEAELVEIKRQQAEAAAKQETKDVPAMPDRYDPNHDELVRQRDEVIAHNAKVAGEQAALEKQQQQLLLEKQQAAAKEIQGLHDGMYANAEKSGIPREEMEKYDKRVVMFIQKPEVAQFILRQPQSDLIVKYLASNATELETLSAMDPVTAAGHIAANIAPQAAKLKVAAPGTPDPLDIPGGRGAPEPQNDYLVGVKME